MPEIPVVKENPQTQKDLATTNAQTNPAPSPIAAPGDAPPVQNDPLGGKVDPTIVDPAQPPTPEPPQAFGPPETLAGDDALPDYNQHREDLGDVAVADRLRAYGLGDEAAPSEQPTAEKGTKTQADKTTNFSKSVAMDLVTGWMESPRQAVGGLRDALQNTINLPEDLAVYAIQKAYEGTPDEAAMKEFLQKRKDKGERELPQFPEIATAKSVTGGLVRGAATFVTGFYGISKVAGVAKGASGIAQILNGMAKGSATSFTAFSGHEQRLSDLVQAHPSLQNPVTEFLASSPEDSAAEGRFKNAIEGEIPGALANSFVQAVKAIKMGRLVRSGMQMMDEMAGNVAPKPTEIKPLMDLAILGDPEKPLLTKQKLDAAATATADIKPEGYTMGAEPSPTGDIKINWSRIDTPEDIQKVMGKMANAHASDIKDAARGTQTFEQIKVNADQVDAFSTLMSRRKGEPLNAEQSVAARNLWVASAQKLSEAADAATNAPSDASLFAFRKMVATHYAIQKEVLAARTETARALGAWKIPVGQDGTVLAQHFSSMLENAGGNATSLYMAQKISGLAKQGNVHAIEHMIEQSTIAKTKDAVAQIWYNGLLSSPKTHLKNVMSNFAAIAQQVYERGAAARISKAMGSEGGVEIGEAAVMASSILNTAREGMSVLAERIRNPGETLGKVKNFVEAPTLESSIPGQKIELAKGGGLSADRWNVSKKTALGKTLDLAEVGTRMNGRLMNAEDDFFKGMGYRMELNARALRQATSEMRGGKITPDQLKTRMAEIIENPPPDIKSAAIDTAAYVTFTQKPAPVLDAIAKKVQSIPFGVGRMLMPFRMTPINLFTYNMERTPLAPFIGSWRADYLAGGARQDVAAARFATGTMILQLGMDLALNGLVTGKGPENDGQRKNWLTQNEPYSVKFGDTVVSYNSADTIGMTLGLGADIAEIMVNAGDEIEDRDLEQLWIGSAFAVSQQVLSKSYMQGTADFFNAINNPKRKGQAFANRIAGSVVPSLVAEGARQMDPTMRAAQDMVDAVRRRIPVLSNGLPPTRDLFGRTMDHRSPLGFAYDAFSPVYIKQKNPEAIDKELTRLEYYPAPPDRKVSFSTQDAKGMNGTAVIQLNPVQYSKYLELAGNGTKAYNGKGCKDFLNEVVSGKGEYGQIYKSIYTDGPDGSKSKFISNWIGRYRDMAKKQMLKEDVGLMQSVQDKLGSKTPQINLN